MWFRLATNKECGFYKAKNDVWYICLRAKSVVKHEHGIETAGQRGGLISQSETN